MMSFFGQYMFQDSSTNSMGMLINLHDHIMMFMMLIITFVFMSMGFLFYNSFSDYNIKNNHMAEMVWTILPGVILSLIAYPSLRLLYIIDELPNPATTVKAIGHQWYWSYEYSDYNNISFDSYLSGVDMGSMNLLEVDNRAVMPIGVDIRLLVTSMDVIHSWAVPSLGVKIDAIPGRLNQFPLHITRPGVFYGMCSEICGAGHAFMPIAVEAITVKDFAKWVRS